MNVCLLALKAALVPQSDPGFFHEKPFGNCSQHLYGDESVREENELFLHPQEQEMSQNALQAASQVEF